MKNGSKNIPNMEGNVQRGVDFNLKKEDLMLLILEGRKEVMEETIAKLQNKQQAEKDTFDKLQKVLTDKCRDILLEAFNKEAKTIANNFGNGEKSFELKLDSSAVSIPFVQFSSDPIKNSSGGAAGSTYIKSQKSAAVNIYIPSKASYKISISLIGKQFVKANSLFQGEPLACRDNMNLTVTAAEQRVDDEAVKKLAEYKTVEEAAKQYTETSSLLSEMITEYDLFCRNQPRAKAAMIKEVLGSDEAGKALLNSITEAAKGVKLLA
jgi:hypothetical protein